MKHFAKFIVLVLALVLIAPVTMDAASCSTIAPKFDGRRQST